MNTADAILRTFESPNVPDRNLEPANVVDVLDRLTYATKRVAVAITPEASAGTDETGGHIESLTEAVMGVTSGLCKIHPRDWQGNRRDSISRHQSCEMEKMDVCVRFVNEVTAQAKGA